MSMSDLPDIHTQRSRVHSVQECIGQIMSTHVTTFM